MCELLVVPGMGLADALVFLRPVQAIMGDGVDYPSSGKGGKVDDGED